MFGLFKKKKTDETEKVEIESSEEIIIHNTDNMNVDQQYDWLEHNGWLRMNHGKDKRNILIMDDREEIISSVIDDLNSLDSNGNFSLDNYNIIAVSSKMAGFHAMEILEKAPDVEINYALLDIVLGGKKSINGKRTMVDGVDVAIQIWEHFHGADILFFSGCIIESSDDKSHFKSRFDRYTGDDLNNFIMPKDVAFEDELDKLTKFFNGF